VNTLLSSRPVLAGCLAALGAFLFAQPAQAGMLTKTFDFTQTNQTSGVDTPPPTFGTVTITADDIAHTVTITYTAADSGAQFDEFGFNTDLTLTDAQITGPTGWGNNINNGTPTPNTQMDGFGSFTVDVKGLGSNRVTGSGVVTISGLSTTEDAQTLLNHFLYTSGTVADNPPTGDTPAQSAVYFAAHIIPSDGGLTFYIGAGPDSPTVVPVPPAVFLVASAVPVLFLGRLLRRRKPVVA
jgi:hypothetical protein